FGSVRVTTETLGADPDPDGYYIYGGGLNGAAQPANGIQVISKVRAGGNEIRLENVAANCVVDPPTQFVNVTFGGTVDARFHISCVESGSLRITTSTTGLDINPEGYLIDVRLLGSNTAPPLHLEPTGTATVSPMLPGTYSLKLFGTPPNCRASTPANDLVKIDAGAES